MLLGGKFEIEEIGAHDSLDALIRSSDRVDVNPVWPWSRHVMDQDRVALRIAPLACYAV